jgi:hypothetical protein
MPRIVSCAHCAILTKMPDTPKGTPMVPARLEWATGETRTLEDDRGFPIMVPKYDPVLEDFVEKHTHGRDDREVIGQIIRVWTVDQLTWEAVDVVTKVKTELEALTGQWYEDRNEYREAAVKCYNAHGNPDMGSKCPDFLDDSKRIGNASYRDDDGRLHIVPNKFRQYLCYQCPYMHAAILPELRHKRGLYK